MSKSLLGLVKEPTDITLNAYERKVASLYNEKQDDINLLLGRSTELIHHHFGVGGWGTADIDALEESEILDRLHSLENRQVSYLLEAMADTRPHHHVFDGGSGRGGTAIMLHQTFGCYYDGANISDYQLAYSRELARIRRIDEKVHFHKMNMRDTCLKASTFEWVITNETTMYIEDLKALYAEFARLLKPRGRYVMMTWAIDANHPAPHQFIDPIDEHYVCKMHTNQAYLEAMLENGLVPLQVDELNGETLPYWLLRIRSKQKTGIEQHYINAYRAGAIRYMRIVAERGGQ